MKNLFLICTIAMTISAANAMEPAKPVETQKYPSQAAALEALTGPRPSDTKSSTASATTGKPTTAEDDDEVEEIPADAPTISNVQTNLPIAGETGQL